PMNTIFPERILDAFREKVQEVLDTGVPVFARITHAADAPGFVDDAFFPIPGSDGGIAGVVIVINANPSMARAEDPDYIWESEYFTYKKHASLSDRDVHTNNFGWRGDDVAVPKPAGVFRIVCVGGSTTEEGATSDTTYPGFLRQKLAAEFGEDRADVINCGIPGLNSVKEKMRLPDYLLLEPDLAVYYNGVNDICHRLTPEWNGQAGLARIILRQSRFFVQHFGRWLLPPDDVIAADIDQKVLAHIRFMQRRFAEHGVPMAVCSFVGPDWPSLSREERDYYSYYHQLEWGGRYSSFPAYCHVLNIFNERVRVLCEELGVTYIPVAERIRGGAQYFSDICHMRTLGIEQKAEAVFLAIRAAVAEKLAAMPPPSSVGRLAEHQVPAHEEVEGQSREDADHGGDLRDALERRP
ncbi:MAG TPA: SGNH/GDSL hydrolase family protein, partial [Candidatus Hydrogenedentes bacterium]|nr:SGNH/GDSL hydrolase family protein [Candidatus Hydrogenedentota bacterium]